MRRETVPDCLMSQLRNSEAGSRSGPRMWDTNWKGASGRCPGDVPVLAFVRSTADSAVGGLPELQNSQGTADDASESEEDRRSGLGNRLDRAEEPTCLVVDAGDKKEGVRV